MIIEIMFLVVSVSILYYMVLGTYAIYKQENPVIILKDNLFRWQLLALTFFVVFAYYYQWVPLILMINILAFAKVFFVFQLFRMRDVRQPYKSFLIMIAASLTIMVTAVIPHLAFSNAMWIIRAIALYFQVAGLIIYYFDMNLLVLKDYQISYKKENERYKVLSKKYDKAMQVVQEGVFEYDYVADTFTLSQGMSKILGIREGVLQEARVHWPKMVHPDDFRLEVKDAFLRFQDNISLHKEATISLEYRVRCADGEFRWIRQKASSVIDEMTGRCVGYGTMSMIQEVKEAEQEIFRLAYYDDLTQLKNLRSFRKDIDTKDQVTQSTTLVLLDIDRFKTINDTRGHRFGDAVIKAVAKRLSDLIGDQANLYRIGGTEFIIRFNAKIDELSIQKYCDLFREGLTVNQSLIYLTCSIGYIQLEVGSDYDSSDNLLMQLDLAKNKVKSSGGNGIIAYGERLMLLLKERVKLSEALRKAMDKDELMMYYQPKVNLSSGHTIGYEALLRWRLNGQFIPPDLVINIAEETGQINELGYYIIRKVMQDAKSFDRRMRIAINISALQLDDIEFPEVVRGIAESHMIDPRRFIFEVTETILMKDEYDKIEILRELRAMGFKISLDDFGSGYSSYTNIERLPIDEIKLDKSFAEMIMKSEKHRLLTENIVNLGKVFDLTVVCEGIELVEQEDFLKTIGCHVGQGYYFEKPRPMLEVITKTVS